MSVTSDLIEALRNHYIAPGEVTPGGVFAAEVGINGSWGTGRRCDALYAGFTSQSGRILIGHEVKISRADWNHEREQLAKADQWADQCHAWYLVAPSEAIIPASEVPPGWGLMVPNPRAKRRFKIVVKATVHNDRNPSWGAVRSMMARMDTLKAQEMRDVIQETVKKRVAERESSLESQYAMRAASSDNEAAKRLATIEEALGIKLVDWAGVRPDHITPEELVTAVKYLRAARHAAGRGWGGLERLGENIEATIKDMRELHATAVELTRTINADIPKEQAS